MKLRKPIINICIVVFFAFSSANYVLACDCGGVLPTINADSLKKYDLIFLGKIDTVLKNELHCTAVFDGVQLFKGLAAQNDIRIGYDCFTSCAMPFAKGQIWIVYAKNTPEKKLIVKFCSRTRKKPLPNETDVYTIYSGIKYGKELLFLQKTFPAKDFGSPQAVATAKKENKKIIDANRYLKHASPKQQIWLVAISLLVLVVIILLIKRMRK